MHWGHRAIYGGNAGIVKATAYCGNAGSIETLVLTENVETCKNSVVAKIKPFCYYNNNGSGKPPTKLTTNLINRAVKALPPVSNAELCFVFRATSLTQCYILLSALGGISKHENDSSVLSVGVGACVWARVCGLLQQQQQQQ
ncbi:unnamed protein product [Ceratitis capitata]|uniref:(Mediterranean fruit fly) hypothetical protein n=1 Tax=Ceratitis capitata TaxID=7213 RepID=A0A811U7Q2_CERCA|nr:unnamed protein product [Ceratitis capitata]